MRPNRRDIEGSLWRHGSTREFSVPLIPPVVRKITKGDGGDYEAVHDPVERF